VALFLTESVIGPSRQARFSRPSSLSGNSGHDGRRRVRTTAAAVSSSNRNRR
jgi:hypothetical protein